MSSAGAIRSTAAVLAAAVSLAVALEATRDRPRAGVVPARAAAQTAARTGVLRGRVDVLQTVPPVERRPSVSDLGTPRDRDVPERRSVVYLESAPRGAFDQVEPGRAAMDQRNETFVPHVLAVTVGTVIDFPNSDRFYHNVFSLSKAARFDLGRYAVGKSKSVRFMQPGIVRVFCEIHSHMNAFILVFGHPFFSMTDTEGRYRINNVPAGTYNVIAWNEGTAADPRPVTITAGGIAELDFTIR
jgi:plastocyanin